MNQDLLEKAKSFYSTMGDDCTEVLETYFLSKNIIVRKENIDDTKYGGNGVIMENAYSIEGDFIYGADNLLTMFPFMKDITKFEKTKESNTICSIGFNEKEQKWYGWSHRAYFGFGIGSEVKFGDCAYKPNNLDNLVKNVCSFWDINSKQITYNGHAVTKIYKDLVKVDDKNYLIIYEEQKHDKNNNLIHEIMKDFDIKIPEVWGKGEWVAQNLEEAKEMAIDFAKGVN